MLPTYPLPLHHSWPLFDRSRRFDLGLVLDEGDDLPPVDGGSWHCRLADQRLRWATPVYDLFGLPHGAAVDRDDIVALYADHSRAAMERLRAYAIRHCRGFTIDVELRPATSEGARWMRIIAAPVCVDRNVVAIEGVKLDVGALYR